MTKNSTTHYLFYIEQNYSFEILRPLQHLILQQGGNVKWMVVGNDVNCDNFTENESVIYTVADAINYSPAACFAPGNVIPNFIPGIKVHLFHGLEWKKKGHFVIRDCFDLYCTHGQAATPKFEHLAQQHQSFDVVETGWPKLDNLFSTAAVKYFTNDKPTILYAPTFSPALTSAPALFEAISALVKENSHNWVLKFHPKMATEWIDQYKKITADNYLFIESTDINQVLQSADIMIADTSSVVGEFSLLGKPVITLNNSAPGDYLINISSAEQLANAIEQAFTPSQALTTAINAYAQSLHPYNDGQSSLRVLNAVEAIINNGKKAPKSLPLNFFRMFKLRKKLGYWKL